MLNCKEDFEDFNKHIWLNAASEGPLPKVAADALKKSIGWKSLPYQLDLEKFAAVPKELKKSIGQLIGVDPKDVILANSASYGIHLLANGLPWEEGDEVLLMQNDFPTDILPWLALERQGVSVKQIEAREFVITPDELLSSITDQSKVFCISQIHTFTGIPLDVPKLAEICRDHNILFVLNLSQSAGNMPVDLSQLPIDAIVCAGYKWLLGPYGTGFCWIKPELRDNLDYNQSYWGARLSNDELMSEGILEYRDMRSARKFDVFGTANFFNFVPFRASIDYLISLGLDQIEQYDQQLVEHFISHLDQGHYQLISPAQGPARSNLVVFSHKKKDRNEEIFQALKSRHIHGAFWKGNIRLSPHIYNSQPEMDQVLEALSELK